MLKFQYPLNVCTSFLTILHDFFLSMTTKATTGKNSQNKEHFPKVSSGLLRSYRKIYSGGKLLLKRIVKSPGDYWEQEFAFRVNAVSDVLQFS